MKPNTTRSGAMGTRRVWERSFDLRFPDSSACALDSSRMMSRRISETTAAAPKLAARKVDVTVTTVVIRNYPPLGQRTHLVIYIIVDLSNRP